MTFTPHITIYHEGNVNHSWFGDTSTRAILIFSKNLDYNKKLARTRINIHLGNEERTSTGGNIKSIWVKNNIDTSLEISEVDKMGILLKIIYHSLMTIAEIEGWDTTNYEKAYKLSVADKGIFFWHTQFKTNKSRSSKARIRISLEKDGRIPIVAEFFDNKSNQQFEILIMDTFLIFINWKSVFVNPIWLENEKFGFNFLNSQLLIFANYSTGKSETVISEKQLNREKIEEFLRMLIYKYFANHKEFIEWANK